MFWTSSAAERVVEQLGERQAWHRGMVLALMNHMLLSVDRAAQEQPFFRFRNALHRCHVTLAAIATNPASTVTPATICIVLNPEAALSALAHLELELGGSWGLRGDRTQLAQDISAELRTTAPAPSPIDSTTPLRALRYEELVTTLAAALRGSAFVGAIERLWHASQAFEHARGLSKQAAAQVTLWDSINVFSESEAELQRDTWGARARAILDESRADFTRADLLLDRALSVYPPALLYYRIGSLRAALLQIRAERRVIRRKHNDYYFCALLGKDGAERALREWTNTALHVFGNTPSNGELLEWFVGRVLRHEADGLPFAPGSLDG
jgi:hypothetical protein